MTRLVDTIERRGWIIRERTPGDRRCLNLTLTPAGEAVALRCKTQVIACWNMWLAGWSKAEADLLVGLLQKLRDTLAAVEGPSRMIRLALLVPLLLAGCAPPMMRQAVAPLAAPALGLAGRTPLIAADWWHGFGDPQLDRIVADATAGSPTLDAALARLTQAQAALATEQAADRPELTLDGSAQVARLSGRYTIPPPYAGSTRSIGSVAGNLSWTLDLFGRQRAAIAGARASARAVALDAAAARLALAGSVVQAYLDLVRAERQAAIAARTIATRERSLHLIDVRIRNRLASNLDRQAAVTLVAQARQALLRAGAAGVLAKQALAALAGRGVDYPATIAPTALSLDAVLPLARAVPADLLARRADIAAALARIDAAEAGRQVARRAYYPDVNLAAMAGLQAIGIGNLVSLDAGQAGVGPAIHLPIFDGGRLRADLAGATAALDLATADYNARVVGAVREAADAIARIGALEADRARQREVVRGFAETDRLNAIRVATGLDSRLSLIDNDVRVLDAAQADADLAAAAAQQRVALVLAGRRLLTGQDPMTDTRTPAAAAPEAASAAPAAAGKPRARRTGLILLAIGVAVAALLWVVFRVLLAAPEQETDDAYVAGDVVAITARDPGTVLAIGADNTQTVRAGQPLIDLDPATADIGVASAEAELARAVRATRSDFSALDESAAAVAQAQAQLAQARGDLQRRQGAAGEGAISGEELSHAADQVRVAAATLALARSRQAQSRSGVQGTTVTTNPAVLAAIAAYRRAAITRNHMHVTAPIDGVVAQRTVQLGQQVAAGTPLMAVVSLDRLWVDANFRETQLRDLRIGQPATIKADMYGGELVFHGRVVGLGAGSGNAFALLPAQNASGNWIKITQRVPVRIMLDPRELRANPLRVGLSVAATVDTADVRGPRIGQPGRAAHAGLRTVAGDPAVETRIRQIIAANR